MATFLRNLRRNGSTDELPELRQLVERLESQQTNLERLVQHADRSIAQLQRLGTLGERVSTLEKQLNGLEHLAPKISAAELQVSKLTGTHDRLASGLAETAEGIEEVSTQAESIEETVAATLRLKEELSGFLAMQQPFRDMRREMDELQTQSQNFRNEMAKVRSEHETTAGGYRTAASRLESFEGDWQRITRTITETEHRIAGLEQLLGDLAPVTETMAQTRRQLAAAKVTSDTISQKVQLLEQQREQIDRATGKLEHLTDLMQRADTGLEQQAEMLRTAAALRTQLEGLSEGHRTLHDQSSAAVDRMGRVESGVATAERTLSALRQTLDQHVERMSYESRTVDGVTDRVAEIRRALADNEKRLTDLTAGTEAISGAASRADSLAAQVSQLGTELARLSELGTRVNSGLNDLVTLEAAINGLTERTCRVEEARPALERAMKDLGSMSATQEAIREALEQLREAREELTETRGRLDNTRSWLAETERSVGGLRNEVAGLDKMRSTVDTFRQEVEQLTASMNAIESRRGLVEDVQRRLGEAAGVSAAMEERARGLTERLDTAENHLGTIIPRLDEVGRAGSQLLGLSADLREVEQRVDGMKESVGELEGEVKDLGELSERMRELSRDMDQRQNALRKATEHLDRATSLRQDAAAAAATLGERAREIDQSLVQADERLAALSALSRELESRTSVLQIVPEKIAGFEARLAEWRGVEQQLAHAMEQAAARQLTVTALQSEIRALYEKIEGVQQDARAVAEAQPQIATTRIALDDILAKLDDSDGVMKTLVDRRRQLDRAEERLAHADTLMTDLRGALEILLSQKAQVDYFLEQANSLSLEAKQAESLLTTLREERRMADRIRGALSELKRQDEAMDRS